MIAYGRWRAKAETEAARLREASAYQQTPTHYSSTPPNLTKSSRKLSLNCWPQRHAKFLRPKLVLRELKSHTVGDQRALVGFARLMTQERSLSQGSSIDAGGWLKSTIARLDVGRIDALETDSRACGRRPRSSVGRLIKPLKHQGALPGFVPICRVRTEAIGIPWRRAEHCAETDLKPRVSSCESALRNWGSYLLAPC